jgi:predicted aldo/keto reductase-like oxidoreductase
MNLQKIDFYHMWCIEDLSQFENVIKKGGPLEGAQEAKKKGLVNHILFSSHASEEDTIEMIETGFFEGMTIGFNIINASSKTRAIKKAYELGLGVVTMNPLGGGILTKKGGVYDFLKKDEEKSVIEAAIRFNASHSEVNVVLVGMAKPKEVEEVVQIANSLEPPSSSVISSIKERFAKLEKGFCTLCQYCLPCPVNISIPVYMHCIDLYALKGLSSAREVYNWNKERKNVLNPPASACTQCKQCEESCTQKLPIIENLKKASSYFEG